MGSSSAEESRKRAEDFIYSTVQIHLIWNNSQKKNYWSVFVLII